MATSDETAPKPAGEELAPQQENADTGERGASAQPAMYFYGVTRARGWLSGRDDDDVARVRYRDIEALVRPTVYEIPTFDTEHVQAHQRALERVMRRATVLPAPYGIVFRGRRQLVRLLHDQYLVFDEGLAFLEGHWELRLHISATNQGAAAELQDIATDVYAELRRFARAAVPFPREERRLFSAAFLVERASWLDFMERAGDLGSAHPELSFDITGPWPAYDFVRIVG